MRQWKFSKTAKLKLDEGLPPSPRKEQRETSDRPKGQLHKKEVNVLVWVGEYAKGLDNELDKPHPWFVP